ncbi:alpha-L-iduronidase-like [Anneissia japonica]|uniref:alpha-L-iduronidase-like n=1 Tax=Anneissia japonica TaxID=1529436 RepID=UPI00142580A4|nr:alpha-L-iduronidase-like [Anneissia japonica]
MSSYCTLLITCILLVDVVSSDNFLFEIDSDKVISKINHFWESTGFCPPDPHQDAFKYMLSIDERQNLAYIGSTPRAGIKQVRIHWLLDLVTLRFVNSDVQYNFTHLDDLIDILWQNGLRPGFELMGNPSNIFTDFENKTQVYMWRDMVQNLAEHYIDIYGLKYVQKWNFETWNEPDHKDFDGLNITYQGFMNYYDACSEGLNAADPSLIFGGPGAGCREASYSKICWGLLDHCDTGTNYFTGETGVRLDFISFHHKGEGHSMYILETEMETIDQIYKLHPSFKNKPIINDEADPLVGWSKSESWRAEATYAAIVAKVVVQHQHLLSKNPMINYSLLSNDNGFLNFYPSFFDQRTLVSRFQMNNTKPKTVQVIKKPVLNVMGLLALMGNEQVSTYGTVNGKAMSNTSDVGLLATVTLPTDDSDSVEISVLVVNSADTSNVTGEDKIQMIIKTRHSKHDLFYCVYLIDNNHGNPYHNWTLFGKPDFPTFEQFRTMRNNQEPVRVDGPKPVKSKEQTYNVNLPKPGVLLLHMCSKSSSAPDQVTGLRSLTIGPNDVLLLWQESCVHSRCLKSYEVQRSDSLKGPFVQVNDIDLIFTAFVFSSKSSSTKGYYRVRAVDYWSRAGEFSVAIDVPLYSRS